MPETNASIDQRYDQLVLLIAKKAASCDSSL